MSSKIINDVRCTCGVKSRIAIAKTAFNGKKTLCTSKLAVNLRIKPVKHYIWSISFTVLQLGHFGK